MYDVNNKNLWTSPIHSTRADAKNYCGTGSATHLKRALNDVATKLYEAPFNLLYVESTDLYEALYGVRGPGSRPADRLYGGTDLYEALYGVRGPGSRPADRLYGGTDLYEALYGVRGPGSGPADRLYGGTAGGSQQTVQLGGGHHLTETQGGPRRA